MNNKRVLAISSGGGHWIELCRIFPAFSDFETSYASVHPQLVDDIPYGSAYFTVKDATRWDKFALIILMFQVIYLLLKLRPDIVVTTGAAPGFFALRFAKLVGAKTIWIDSIANVDELSLSGQKISRHADLWLTQWPHLATVDGPKFMGAVM